MLRRQPSDVGAEVYRVLEDGQFLGTVEREHGGWRAAREDCPSVWRRSKRRAIAWLLE